MTPVERVEIRLEAVRATILFLTSNLTKYQAEETELIYELNRARRLEKELQK